MWTHDAAGKMVVSGILSRQGDGTEVLRFLQGFFKGMETSVSIPQKNAGAGDEDDACPMPPGFSLAREGKNAGLWHTEPGEDDGPPLEVLGITRDARGKDWGLLLARHTPDGGRTWAMPKFMLKGDPAEYRKRLAYGGWSSAPNAKARGKLVLLLATVRPKTRTLCVPRNRLARGRLCPAG